VLGLFIVFVPHMARAADPSVADIEFFEKKIRPILVEHCLKCHGAEAKLKANLSLASRATLLKGGDTGPAVVPGDPDKSLLVKAIHYNDEPRMPPKGKLADQQIADLTAWVRKGVPWPESAATNAAGGVKPFNLKERARHWSFQPLTRPAVPAVKQTDWAQNAIDRFILAKLEANGLKPALPADKRSLLRRVTFDLIGLPPTPAEIESYIGDSSANAYEKVVERLLASPRYGERWGRHWLDLVRYAETLGHEFDVDLPLAHVYRDYVIRAFNEDVSYDQFVTEHIAGDLLPTARWNRAEGFNESIIGTGFWTLGESVHSPVDVRGDECDRIDNQLDVFGKAFLGITIACARCHDHKFDPITQKDYYSLAGFLRSSRAQKAFIDPPERSRSIVRELQEVQRRGRSLTVARTVAELRGQISQLARKLAADEGARQRIADAGLLDKGDARYAVYEDFARPTFGNWFVSGAAFGDGPSTGAALVKMDESIRHAVAPDVAHSGLISNKLQGVLRSPSFTIDKSHVLYRVMGRDCHVNLIIDGYQLIRDPIYGGLTIQVNKAEQMEWRAMNVAMWKGHRAYIEIVDDGPGFIAVDRILFADSASLPKATSKLFASLPADQEARTARLIELCEEIVEHWQTERLSAREHAAECYELLNWLLRNTRSSPEDGELSKDEGKKLADLMEAQGRLEAQLPQPRRAMALEDGTGENLRIHIRGNHKNLGDVAPRRFLEVFVGDHVDSSCERCGRLELARRLVAADNPLLPRVIVNRLWQHHFGEGIVRSVDNFGVLGERPTHPELLDSLATELIREGWSLKRLHRLMVLSSTYRMASQSTASADQADPENKLLHRMSIRRLEAECIRDAMLAVSGRLDGRMYGPSVMPHLTPFMAGRGRPGASGPLDGDGRRSLYINVRRNFLTPMFLAFDYPIPFTTMGRRSVSNVPAQALTLMNNPFVLQQAETWAKRVLAEPNLTDDERIAKLYVSAFGRLPSTEERDEALAFLASQNGARQRGDAWKDLCHVLFNVKEFIFVN
jgi:hypothetical protein